MATMQRVFNVDEMNGAGNSVDVQTSRHCEGAANITMMLAIDLDRLF
jgi:hypothetical protein